MIKKEILIMLFFLLLVSPLITAIPNEEITFITLGHIYTDYQALELSIPLINEENPDFVIFLGDSLINPTHEDWKVLKMITSQIKAPIYFVPGNHDIYENGSKGGYFIEEFSDELFTNFDIGENTFIILNSVTNEQGVYDISDEQIAFVEAIYKREDNKNKFIFMHHCLFYNYDNQFCNSREFIKKNNWNKKIVPLIKDETSNTIAVFVGDTGLNEPYFGYEEDGISYFGVGFSPEQSQLKIPQHFLKVTFDGENLTVKPILIRQDLNEAKYYGRTDRNLIQLAKSFIKKNLAKILKLSTLTIVFLALIIVFLLFKLLRIVILTTVILFLIWFGFLLIK